MQIYPNSQTLENKAAIQYTHTLKILSDEWGGDSGGCGEAQCFCVQQLPLCEKINK